MSVDFLDLVDLASERLGAAAIEANDEFFAPKDNLVKAEPPIWIEGKYTQRGKWVDGWETRRRREAGYDWCVVRLGVAGIIRGIDVETTYFRGNYPEACALDVGDGSQWCEVLARTRLKGDAHNVMGIASAPRATHVRLRIFPDGGVARLRVYGDVVTDWDRLRRRGDVDLAAVEHGGLVVGCSDMFFGSRHNLIMPGDATHMGDGWKTKRRRGPGHDWTVIRLGARGVIRRIVVDTRHFKGNAPGWCSVEGTAAAVGLESDATYGEADWREILPRTALQPHARQEFEDEVQPIGNITHARFNIFPDGGVGRLRLFGRPA